MRYSAKPASREESIDFFEPWGGEPAAEPEAPAESSAPRGEAVPLQAVRDAVREAIADTVGESGPESPRPRGRSDLEFVLPESWCRDDDPAEFLREVGIPTILSMAMRVQSARHRAALQDLLSLQPPALRLLLWLWPGPMDSDERRTHATLEFVVERTGEFGVSARYWMGRQGLNPVLQSRVPVQALSEEWLSEQVLEFLERTLRPIENATAGVSLWSSGGPLAASS